MAGDGRRLRIEPATGGDVELGGDEVEAGGALGDRMLDLQPGVHLQEVEPAAVVGQEFDGAGPGVVDRLRCGAGGLEQPGPHAVDLLDERRRRLLDHLLVSPLDRALAFADRPYGAVRVGKELHLDVPSGREIRLTEDGRIAEGTRRFDAGSLDGGGQVGQLGDDAHAAPAATCRCLDQQRQVRGGDLGRVEFGEHRHPGIGHQLLRRDLAAHRGDRLRRRADPRQTGARHDSRERRVLREEAVTRMDRVRAGAEGGIEDQVRAQVGVGARRSGQPHRGVGLRDVRRVGVGIGEHRDGADPEGPAGTEHPPRDLAAIRHQHPTDRHRHRTPLIPVINSPIWSGSDPFALLIRAGTPRSHSRPRLGRCGPRTGRCRERCGCRAGR